MAGAQKRKKLKEREEKRAIAAKNSSVLGSASPDDSGSEPETPTNTSQAQGSSFSAASGPAPSSSPATTQHASQAPESSLAAASGSTTQSAAIEAASVGSDRGRATQRTLGSDSSVLPTAPIQDFENLNLSGSIGHISSAQGSSAQASSTQVSSAQTSSAQDSSTGKVKRVPLEKDSHRNKSRVRALPASKSAEKSAGDSEDYDQAAFHIRQRRARTQLENLRDQEIRQKSSEDAAVARMKHFTLRPPTPARGNIKVLTNHFSVTIPPKKVLYEYSVNGIPENATRSKRRMLVLDMIEIDPDLYRMRNTIATDYNKKIISSVSLFADNPSPGQILRHITVNDFRAGSRDAPARRTLDLTFTAKYELDGLKDFVEGRNEFYQEKGAKEALNIVIAKAVTDSDGNKDVFQVGNNRFYYRPGYSELPAQERTPESIGLITTRGYYSTIKPGMNGLLLNVNNVCSAFYRPQRLDNYLKGCWDLYDDEWERMKAHLQKLRVAVNFDRGNAPGQNADLDTNARRYKTVVGFGDKSFEQTFRKDANNPRQIVWDHLAGKYTLTNDDTTVGKHLPCVNVGGKEADKQKFYLPTQLNVLADQLYRGTLPPEVTADMIKVAKKRPEDNYSEILGEGIQCLKLHDLTSQPPMLQSLGLRVSPKLLSLPARSIAVPKIQYRDHTAQFSKGKWDIPEGAKFVNTAKNFGPSSRVQFFKASGGYANNGRSLPEYARQFVRHSAVHGTQQLQFRSNRDQFTTITDWSPSAIQSLLLTEHAMANFDLAVVIFPNNNATNRKRYNDFKIVVDQFIGFKSICLNEKKISTSAKFDSLNGYLSSVFAKLNVRCGNFNHMVKTADLPIIGSSNDTIILGADVTHGSASSLHGTPSIAALVGTLDGRYARFSGSMRLNPARQESIRDMQVMARERLDEWRQVNNKLPSRILFYRDGVGESQYATVRQQEVAAIRRAWMELRPSGDQTQLRLTAVVVTKRHNTRLYPSTKPKGSSTKSGNCLPGTVVETGITSPYYFDFFLLSHDVPGGSGTAKPSHYFVLENGMNFDARQLQDLTLQLCFMYCRSLTPVSYVPAAYYADRLCERGSLYLKRFKERSGTLREQDLSDVRIFAEAANDFYRAGGATNGVAANPWHPNLNGTMFWM